MFKRLALAAVAAALFAGMSSAARADMSACESASVTKEPRERIRLYTICIEKGGNNSGNVGGALNNRGVDYMKLGDLDKAMADFTLTIQYIPNWAFGYLNRASIYAGRRDWAHAEADLDHAVKLDPVRARATAFRLRAAARAARADFKDAISDDEDARMYDPKLLGALNHEAWILATCPDASVRNGGKAVDLAQKAVKLRDDAPVHDTLAAAYAEAGNFTVAQQEEERAIQFLGPDASAASTADYKSRLDLYKGGMPFHTAEPPRPLE